MDVRDSQIPSLAGRPRHRPGLLLRVLLLPVNDPMGVLNGNRNTVLSQRVVTLTTDWINLSESISGPLETRALMRENNSTFVA
jgi:hypothetical protein